MVNTHLEDNIMSKLYINGYFKYISILDDIMGTGMHNSVGYLNEGRVSREKLIYVLKLEKEKAEERKEAEESNIFKRLLKK